MKWITYPPTHILLKESLSCTFFLKTMKLWSKWSSKTEVPQRDMRQEFTELLLIGCLTESTWNPRLKSNLWTPKTNSLTFWPKVIGAMSKRGQDVTSGGDSVHWGCLAQIYGSLVNLGADDERKLVGLASGNWGHSDSNFEVGNSEVNRQEKVNLNPQETWAERPNLSKKSGELLKHKETSCIITRVGEHETVESSVHGNDIPILTKEIGKFFTRCYFLNRIVQNESIDVDKVHGVVDESHQSSWAVFPHEFGSLQEHKIREHR